MSDISEDVHRQLSANLFNAAWDHIDNAQRTSEDEEEMLRLAMASHYHWTQRDDYAPIKASIANWQLSRAFALMEEGSLARRYAQRALLVLDGDSQPPFFVAYAHEALARAASVDGDAELVSEHVRLAKEHANRVEKPAERDLVLADLDTIAV
ncbi:MAG: hypothetical protein ACI81R_002819 [Bradymonadia bacterium]|jgi:hypothetical protein